MLDNLEQVLQNLLEKHMSSMTHDIHTQLAQKLALNLQNNLHWSADKSMTMLPDTFTLVMHPEQMKTWNQEPERIEAFKTLLLELAQNLGLVFAGSPHISLAANPSLEKDTIEVIASHRLASVSNTQNYTASETSAQSQDPTPPPDSEDNIPPNAYLIMEGGRIFKLKQAVVNLGRRLDNHLVLNDPRVSRNHAQLRAINGRYVLFDLNSTGGTYVNGQRITQCILYAGDVISLAGEKLVYRQDGMTAYDHDHAGTKPLGSSGASDIPTAIFKSNPNIKKKDDPKA
jgi:pSer/pThr/pTyr-binding forkhead associated (FHA) protein